MLSVINSAVLLALLGGLGGASYLARTGRLESALPTAGSPLSSGGGSSAQAFFALVRVLACAASLWGLQKVSTRS